EFTSQKPLQQSGVSRKLHEPPAGAHVPPSDPASFTGFPPSPPPAASPAPPSFEICAHVPWVESDAPDAGCGPRSIGVDDAGMFTVMSGRSTDLSSGGGSESAIDAFKTSVPDVVSEP